MRIIITDCRWQSWPQSLSSRQITTSRTSESLLLLHLSCTLDLMTSQISLLILQCNLSNSNNSHPSKEQLRAITSYRQVKTSSSKLKLLASIIRSMEQHLCPKGCKLGLTLRTCRANRSNSSSRSSFSCTKRTSSRGFTTSRFTNSYSSSPCSNR